jgi:hypothetical protein
MPTKDQAKTIKNYIEVFFAAFLIVSSISFLVWNKGNHFNNTGAIAFFVAGVWEYKKRKQKNNNQETR